MNSQFNVCPLCDKVCQLRKVAGVTFFSCPTQSIDIPHKSHFEVEFNKTEIQHIIIYPYSIDTFLDTAKSRVYYSSGLKNGEHHWRLLMEVSLIRAESESKLLDRINKLVTFL